MATLYAQSTGNWDAINWNTAANGSGSNETPAAADTLISNGYTVTVNGTYTVTKVTNTGGGTFTLANGSHLTCTDGTAGVVGDASDVGAVTFALTGDNEAATLTSKVLGGNGSKEWGVNFTGTKTLTINGSVTGGSFAGAAATSANGVQQTGAGTLIVSVTPGTTALSGGSGAHARGINNVDVAATITVTGNVIGGSGNGSSIAISATGAATITVNGNLTGGAAAALGNTGAATVTVNGDVTASAVMGFSNTGSSAVIAINGTLTASSTAAAVTNTQATARLTLSGPFVFNAANAINPVYSISWNLQNNPAATYYELRNASLNDSIRLYTANHPDSAGGQPVQADVKTGVVYGPSDEFTGSFASTVTPAVADIADAVWNHLLADMETADSAGARLKELASTDAVGGIVTALGA